MLVMFGTMLMERSPVIVRTLGKFIESDVPVAIAILPEKVEQVARAEASPAFSMVAVAEVLQDAKINQLA
jgi:hypothetical protein